MVYPITKRDIPLQTAYRRRPTVSCYIVLVIDDPLSVVWWLVMMDTVLVTPVAVVLLLMMMISTNTAQLTIEATREGPGSLENLIQLTCRDNDTLSVTRANFYRRDPQDGRELLIYSNVNLDIHFISKETEGFYFCNNSMGQSNIQPITGIFLSDVFLLSDVILLLTIQHILQEVRLLIHFLHLEYGELLT